jgi:hypothetical protein
MEGHIAEITGYGFNVDLTSSSTEADDKLPERSDEAEE